MLATQFCLPAEYYADKAARLNEAGWLLQADTASPALPGQGGMQVYANEMLSGIVMVLTHAANDDRFVASCMVDGRNLDAESLVRAAYRSFRPVFGEPVQEGETVVWRMPQLQREITLAPSRVLNQDNPDRAFMIHVRLAPVSENESQH